MDFEQISAQYRDTFSTLLAEQTSLLPSVRSVFVATVDGHTIVHQSSQQDDEQRVSAMAGSLFALSETLTQELSCEDCRHIAIQTSTGPITLVRIPDKTQQFVLCAVADNKAPLGSLLAWVNGLGKQLATKLDQN